MFIFVFVLGAVFGSFINVIIDRLPRGEPFLKGRSHCESCKKEIKPYDLIPVVSFLLLRGKCRNCHKSISKRTIFMELGVGVLFTLLYLLTFSSVSLLILYCFATLIILAIALIDIDYGIIPDVLLGVLGATTLFYLGIYIPQLLIPNLIAGVCAFIFFLIIFLATKGKGLGFGDVKYAFFIGLFLGGPQTIVAFYAAFLTGAAVSIILILVRKKKFKGSTIPFGPFLSLGMFMSMLFGNVIIAYIAPFLGI